jgi:hypothetical protein
VLGGAILLDSGFTPLGTGRNLARQSIATSPFYTQCNFFGKKLFPILKPNFSVQGSLRASLLANPMIPGDLVEALRNGPTDPDFDLKTCEQEWAAAEAEMKRINLPN